MSIGAQALEDRYCRETATLFGEDKNRKLDVHDVVELVTHGFTPVPTEELTRLFAYSEVTIESFPALLNALQERETKISEQKKSSVRESVTPTGSLTVANVKKNVVLRERWSPDFSLNKEYAKYRAKVDPWFLDVIDGPWVDSLVSSGKSVDVVIREALATQQFEMPADFSDLRDQNYPLLHLTKFILARAFVEKTQLRHELAIAPATTQNRGADELLYDLRHLQLDIGYYQKKTENLEKQRHSCVEEKEQSTKRIRELEGEIEELKMERAHSRLDVVLDHDLDGTKRIETLRVAHRYLHNERLARMRFEDNATAVQEQMKASLTEQQEATKALSSQLKVVERRSKAQNAKLAVLRRTAANQRAVMIDLGKRYPVRWPAHDHMRPMSASACFYEDKSERFP